MPRAIALMLLVGVACSSAPPPEPATPVAYRIIAEERNHMPCVDGADFRVVADEDGWVDVFDIQTSCLGSGDLRLPDVDFEQRMALAAWWAIEVCPGHAVDLRAVERTGTEVAVRAVRTDPPDDDCEGAVGLETFLSVPLLVGVDLVRFVLDDRTVGTVTLDA